MPVNAFEFVCICVHKNASACVQRCVSMRGGACGCVCRSLHVSV